MTVARGVRTALAIPVLAAAVLAGSPVAAASPGASPPAPGPTVTAGPLPLPPSTVPGGPPVRLADLPPELARAWSAAALVDIGGGCSGVLVAPGTGPVPAGAPATVLTNGHCIDFLPPTAVRRDLPDRGRVTFGWPGAGPIERDVPIRAIPWASMKGTDLAVLTLDEPLADLVAAGIRPLPIAAELPPAGTPVVIVGGPSHPDRRDRPLELAACLLGPRHDLVEGAWSWAGFPSQRCADIRPGSSGSPVLDPATGRLIGLVNTGTDGSDRLPDCAIDRPCEVSRLGGRSAEGTSYGPPVAGLGGCFDAGWRFRGPGPGCPLDPGAGVEVTGEVRVTNPDRAPISGRLPRTTWGARLVPSDPSVDHVRLKSGPLGMVDCRDAAGYGPPLPIATQPALDLPLPRADGRYQLCLLGGPGTDVDAGWQEPRFSTVVTAWVDRTPPSLPGQLRVRATGDGWTVEPVPVPTELVSFRWKVGPAATTDCANPEGYVVWRHAPREVARTGAPWRVCAIGYDEASNPAPTLDRVLE